jgi:hypothetical protein
MSYFLGTRHEEINLRVTVIGWRHSRSSGMVWLTGSDQPVWEAEAVDRETGNSCYYFWDVVQPERLATF